MPNHAELIEHLYESRLERNLLLILLSSALYVSVREQPKFVWYFGADGERTKHWFDFFVTEGDGTRIAVDVKPLHRLESSGIVVTQRLIREQLGSSYADRYVILTEEEAHPDDVADARLILRARRMQDTAADEAVARIVSTLNGWTPLRGLVASTGMKAAAFNALARLIGAGGAKTYQNARISYGAYVTRAAAA